MDIKDLLGILGIGAGALSFNKASDIERKLNNMTGKVNNLEETVNKILNRLTEIENKLIFMPSEIEIVDDIFLFEVTDYITPYFEDALVFQGHDGRWYLMLDKRDPNTTPTNKGFHLFRASDHLFTKNFEYLGEVYTDSNTTNKERPFIMIYENDIYYLIYRRDDHIAITSTAKDDFPTGWSAGTTLIDKGSTGAIDESYAIDPFIEYRIREGVYMIRYLAKDSNNYINYTHAIVDIINNNVQKIYDKLCGNSVVCDVWGASTEASIRGQTVLREFPMLKLVSAEVNDTVKWNLSIFMTHYYMPKTSILGAKLYSKDGKSIANPNTIIYKDGYYWIYYNQLNSETTSGIFEEMWVLKIKIS